MESYIILCCVGYDIIKLSGFSLLSIFFCNIIFFPAALLLFSQSKADFLILETGLGGRLDATNIIKKSLIDIITTIGKDHQEFLGTSLKKITNETENGNGCESDCGMEVKG